MQTLSAYAKINWALNITGRREDGYHLLDMLMQTIDLRDDLAVEPADGLSLTVNGAPAGEENLILRAANALNRYAGSANGARLSLTKRIPAQAGLGGGSADCALALRALNGLWSLGLSNEELLRLGERLGADVPFCLTGGLARVSGIGEHIAAVANAPEIPLVLVTPGGGLSTAEVFSLWDGGGWPTVELDTRALAAAVVRRDLAEVDRLCANALTAPALSLMPEIGELLERLRALGAGAAFMTGSGSTVVGAFADIAAARAAAERLPGAILTKTLAELPRQALSNGNFA
ncbi:MAG: 4-(cytidine 5'-diphospho)-2-C-methyl-D-erythritol kinase [Clostridia bacterium]|nr:4-(cytidine 5'-diphospho)-2-C-methyl-D-erythritol kinase [Clostridia bacterium]